MERKRVGQSSGTRQSRNTPSRSPNYRLVVSFADRIQSEKTSFSPDTYRARPTLVNYTTSSPNCNIVLQGCPDQLYNSCQVLLASPFAITKQSNTKKATILSRKHNHIFMDALCLSISRPCPCVGFMVASSHVIIRMTRHPPLLSHENIHDVNATFVVDGILYIIQFHSSQPPGAA